MVIIFLCTPSDSTKKFALTQKDNFVQIAEHRYQVETSFFSPDGALLRWVGTLTQLWVNKCIVRCNWSPNGLQNACKMFERRLKTVERSSQSTPSFLRSQSEVAGYMGGRLQVSDKSHRPPGLPLNYWSTSILYFCLISVAVARLPWKDDLIDTNKLFVPNLENLANIVGTAGNLARAVKRPGDGGGGAGPGEEKRACPEPLPLFPL